MIISKKALPRRTFLRGTGAALALPLLDAMVPSMTALAETPANPAKLRRLGFVYMPMGCDITRWTPPKDSSLEELSPILRPLEPVKQQVTAITKTELQNAYPGTHATSNASFLSAAKAKRTERILAKTPIPVVRRQDGAVDTPDVYPPTAFAPQACIWFKPSVKKQCSSRSVFSSSCR